MTVRSPEIIALPVTDKEAKVEAPALSVEESVAAPVTPSVVPTARAPTTDTSADERVIAVELSEDLMSFPLILRSPDIVVTPPAGPILSADDAPAPKLIVVAVSSKRLTVAPPAFMIEAVSEVPTETCATVARPAADANVKAEEPASDPALLN